ncbi:MAG: Lysophospholipid transporter LplT [Chlamydiia bacterium]|nr:Lysophospholipid transporter LplT [Chlamydiia bacterium]
MDPGKKKLSPFGLLNTIQFLAAINENLFRLLVTYFLIYELGRGSSKFVAPFIGILFLAPFILFSNFGGFLADRFRKQGVMFWTRVFESITLFFALFAFYFKFEPAVYILLFCMASLSSLFGPSKYGLIPELTEKHRIVWANSIIAAFTFAGIIIGIALSSLLVHFFNHEFFLPVLFSFGFALTGLILSLFIPPGIRQNPDKPLNWCIFKENFITFKEMRETPSFNQALVSYSYFLFVGTYIQLNIIPYTVLILHLKDYISGYLFLITSLGLVIGAFLAHIFSKESIKLGFIPITGIGMSICVFLMALSHPPILFICLLLFIAGLLGGLYLVPAQAFVLQNSNDQSRGRNFGVANLLSFVFALLAAIILFILSSLLDLAPTLNFFILGVINLFVMGYFLLKTNWVFAGSN